MPEYEIQRWDAVIPKGNTLPYPMIYIKPDKKFEDYAKQNSYMVLIQISGTDMAYDTSPVVGMIENSGYFPTYKPNFFNDTGMYVITLLTNWIGYPKTNGKVLLQGLEGPDKVTAVPPPPFVAPKPLPWNWNIEGYDEPVNKLTSTQIAWILVGVFIVFCVLLAISFKMKHIRSK